MKKIYAVLSIIFGCIAGVLVISNFFHTPPLSVTIASLLGFIFGLISWHEQRVISIIGIFINIISLLYLIY